MNYYKEIKTKLIENENYAKITDYSKERYKVQTYSLPASFNILPTS